MTDAVDVVQMIREEFYGRLDGMDTWHANWDNDQIKLEFEGAVGSTFAKLMARATENMEEEE